MGFKICIGIYNYNIFQTHQWEKLKESMFNILAFVYIIHILGELKEIRKEIIASPPPLQTLRLSTVHEKFEKFLVLLCKNTKFIFLSFLIVAIKSILK